MGRFHLSWEPIFHNRNFFNKDFFPEKQIPRCENESLILPNKTYQKLCNDSEKESGGDFCGNFSLKNYDYMM